MSVLKIMFEEEECIALAFAYVLTTIREERNLSEEDFAGKAGLAQDHYWNLESGTEEPTIYCLMRIAAAIDLKPEELLQATCARLAVFDREKSKANEA